MSAQCHQMETKGSACVLWLCHDVHLNINQVIEETLSTVVRSKSINKEVVSVKMSCDSADISLILLSYS